MWFVVTFLFSKLDFRLIKLVIFICIQSGLNTVFDFRVGEVLKHVVSGKQVQPSVQARRCVIQWLLKQELLQSASWQTALLLLMT